MKITHNDLLYIEDKRKVITIQSEFPEIAYAVDKKNNVIWMINRQTGAQIEMAAENVYKLAFEMMDVTDLYLQQNNLFTKGA